MTETNVLPMVDVETFAETWAERFLEKSSGSRADELLTHLVMSAFTAGGALVERNRSSEEKTLFVERFVLTVIRTLRERYAWLQEPAA